MRQVMACWLIPKEGMLMRILITNAYSWGNKGDCGILLGTVDLLRRLYGRDLEIDILSFSQELDRKHYLKLPNIHGVYENVICPYRPNPLHLPWGIRILLDAAWQRSLLAVKAPFLLKRDSYRAIQEADFVIACGGGYLGGDCFSLNYLQLFLIDTCLKLRKKVVMIGNSVEPCTSSYIRRRLHRTLSRLETVFAREAVTYQFLTEELQLENVCMVPDLAFMLQPEPGAIDLRRRFSLSQDRPLFGITVRNCSNDPAKVEAYVSAVAQVMDRCISELQAQFVFLPQVRFLEDDDLQIAKVIRDRLEADHRSQFILLEEDYAPGLLKSMIGQCDYFFGTRMHSNIFATSMSVPTVAIAYEEKTNGIMRMLGLEDYVLGIDTLEPEACYQRILNCVQHREEISSHLQQRIPEIRQQITDRILPYLEQNFPKNQ